MGDDNCACPVPPSALRRAPRMGVSSLGSQPQRRFDRRLPLSSPIAPRPASPPPMPRTVPGLSRTPRRGSPCLDKTLSPGPADRTLTGSPGVKMPDFDKFGSTMEELGKLEFVEMQNIEDDLREFHIKRRKLMFSITSINLSKAKKSIRKAVNKMGL